MRPGEPSAPPAASGTGAPIGPPGAAATRAAGNRRRRRRGNGAALSGAFPTRLAAGSCCGRGRRQSRTGSGRPARALAPGGASRRVPGYHARGRSRPDGREVPTVALETRPRPGQAVRRRFADYAELTKARLSALVVLTAAAGYAAAGAPLVSIRFAAAVLGVGLAALGANGLNQWWEAPLDARMERTRGRPIPAGRLSPREALVVSLLLAGTGVTLLAACANVLSGALALAVILLYVLAYTPLKTRSSLCTIVGAVCGALPPMIGWAAADGRVAPGAFLLAGILFAWQMPHSLSLAWLYREDYEKGGFRLLPVVDREGSLTGSMVVLYSLVLVPLGLLATLGGLAGAAFALGSALLGGGLTGVGIGLFRNRSRRQARRVFLATLIYLPALLGLLTADRVPRNGLSSPAVAEARLPAASPDNSRE
ncbi:MAG: protoheme IX farnesyltransferase [Acidobacteria bacterium]|nr:MAG: protoheme IX farnesyltransferase [Acidobacteriota bacterium]